MSFTAASRAMVLLVLCLTRFIPPTFAATYQDWAALHGLIGAGADPAADPDGDSYVNALEFAFGSSPALAELEPIHPVAALENGQLVLTYRVGTAAEGAAHYRVIEADNMEDLAAGREVDATPYLQAVTPAYSLHSQFLHLASEQHFYRMEVVLPLTQINPVSQDKVAVGANIGTGYWDGLPSLANTFIRTVPPDVNPSVPIPNRTKYPEVAGAGQIAATKDFLNTLSQTGRRLPRRSWMGWFLWGNGTPPPGLSPGYPVTGQYDTNQSWDYFSYQFSAKGTNEPPEGQSWAALHGNWKAIRLDQQPLYANPFRINYAWPPGLFGYKTQPLQEFVQQTGYWAEKRIVRGPNLSFPNPFFLQYADYVSTGDTPDVWRDSWFYQRTRPLETLLLVPSNLKPNELLQNGNWNATGDGGTHEPFPYPVWDTGLAARDQTPFTILVDRMGDWDADLIWEGTHPGATGYETNRYRRTAFNDPGQGNYLKMTVAQGSPFIWCESHNNRYQVFYNLIRQNLTNRIASNEGTDAKVVPGGPWPVPGVSDVSYVLLYGDHNNPNQWYQEEAPWYYDMPNGQPGGFNPPGAQHNHTYMAVFYRTSSAQSVVLGGGGTGAVENNGTDGQGNPYFYLDFKQPGKNWFVVGAVPVMSYYHTEVPVDSESTRIAGARDWAEQMGLYAFNFLVDTKISYASENMTKVATTYANHVRNPFVASGDSSGAGLTPNNTATVMALLPHQYQPLTLGPDLTQAARPQVVWNPLRRYDADFPNPASAPPNANRNDPNTASRWGYWGPRGNMKAIITGSLVTEYPFQNFLPVMPPPNLETNYLQTGIQAVRITDAGTGNHAIVNPVPNATIFTSTPEGGSGATFKVLLEPNTGRVMQVDVASPGFGYPDGNPPDSSKVWLTIDPPQIPAANGSRQAKARLQIGGGKVLATFMDDKGAGYDSTIVVTQAGRNIDPPIIKPVFDDAGNLQPGLARVVSGGAGFDFNDTANPPVATVISTGTGAKAEVLEPGSVFNIRPFVGGFTAKGYYPSSGNEAEDKARIIAELPPPAPGRPAQQVAVTAIGRILDIFAAMVDRGQYETPPTASFVDDSGVTIPLNLDFNGGRVGNVFRAGGPAPNVVTPKQVTFAGGNPTRPAQAWIYGAFSVERVEPTGPEVAGYSGSTVVSFRGGEVLPPGVTMPQLSYHITPAGTVDPASVVVTDPGTGWTYGGVFKVAGGKGYDAAVSPTVGSTGQILGVKVLRGGNNYPTNIFPRIIGGNSATAKASVRVEGGSIVAVDMDPLSPGAGYVGPVITFTSSPTGDEVNQPAKGDVAEISFEGTPAGGITNVTVTKVGAGYIPGTETNNTPDSPRTFLRLDGHVPLAQPPGLAAGFVADVVSPTISVEQVIYDNLLSEYTKLASSAQRPFGGGFGGASGTDGYGLGNQISAAAKVIGIYYNFQRHFDEEGRDQPFVAPSSFALDAANTPVGAYEFPIFQEHHPVVSLRSGLETAVQGLQRTLSLFHQDPPPANSPAQSDWTLQYFSQYDTGVGRVVINPSGANPVLGVVSSVAQPPEIPDAENVGKEGLKHWDRGMLWSGFGVSDQWNDQHYFFGYYLGAAGLMAIFDRSWETNLTARPSTVWSDAGQMGTGIDQWLMTLAYDPDNPALAESLYLQPGFSFQKFAFFDQWNGHAWATGLSPGRAGDVEDGLFGANVPWSVWRSHGTGSGGYDDENENSIWEGLQAWSAILLWGGGTDRKPVVDLGMYLLATGNAAGDLYFHDKNYNLPRSSSNRFSWVPVTTVPSSAVGMNGGNIHTPANSGFIETTPAAFYTAPEFFGGEASAGTSILHKGSPSLNNFFYAFPTGSKFIQSYPPTPWTLGMSRNSDYVRRWAGAMMRDEWRDARNTSLFQPANWLSMAMAAAVSGVPYNPGDTPYPINGATPKPDAPDPYVGRLWSSWVTATAAAGAEAAPQPAFKPLEVLTTLHTFAEYGTPDWTYLARATDSTGVPDNNAIVFTATFSRIISPTSVRTTFVAFNPGWAPRHAAFYRLAQDGSIGGTPVLPTMPLRVGPKRLQLVTHDFAVQ